MTDNDFKIFVDFDGTITKQDVGDSLFMEFADREKVDAIVSDLLSDRISAKECWMRLCDLPWNYEIHKIDSFIDTMEIDTSFHNFINYCDKNRFDVFVLSDGFDYYINRIFRREGLSGVRVFSNRLTVTEERFIPEFPFLDENCRTSANCKRNHIISNSSDDDFTVYIGDGNSDKHPAQFCDFIFAKDNLLKFCEKERISYFPFNNFDDIIYRMDDLKNKKRLRKRHQAALKRREAYITE